MKSVALLVLALFVSTGARALTSETAEQSAKARPGVNMPVSEIVDKNALARGGVEAWQKIKTMAAAGRIEGAGVPGREMPFTLEQKRPASTRFLISAQNQKSARVFNGVDGWKLKPDASGKPDMQAYSPDELRFARESQVIDGPLMDDVARRGAMSVLGVDVMDGRKHYVLAVKLPSGASHRIWVDAQTFLESKLERDVRLADGRAAISTIIFRDYRPVEGLVMPMLIETGGDAGAMHNRLVIERVALNPELDDRMFEKPIIATPRRKGVTVDARSVHAGSPSAP